MNTENQTVIELNMPFINDVTITGRLTNDPELVTKSDNENAEELVKISVAHNSFSKTNSNENTIFIDVNCWGKLGASVGKCCKKGSPVIVRGRLCMRSWTDKENVKRSKIYITAQNVSILNRADLKGSGE